MLESAESKDPGLISREIIFCSIPTYVITITIGPYFNATDERFAV